MSKNILQRTTTSTSQESYVYQNSQYPGSSFSQQTLLAVRGSNTDNIFTKPFGVTTGQWRPLNLLVDPTEGYGSAENGAILSFGFSNNSTSPQSMACGFTLGVPPLHARHVNTVTRSICYGFILNPFPTTKNDLYIVHENTLTKLAEGVPFGFLSIEIQGNKVTYKSSGEELLTSTMSSISMVLYVVGCLGFNGNQITNVSLVGGSSASFNAPDYQKELYIPCLGLNPKSQNTICTQNPIGSSKVYSNDQTPADEFGILTNILVKGTSTKKYTVYYPNGLSKEFTPTATEEFEFIGEESISSFSPFTIKIVFEGGLSDLKGLIVANPLTSTELSLDQSLEYLTNLEHLEVRSSFAVIPEAINFNPFYPTIGENLPLPTKNSQLKLANLEGTYELKEHDFSRQQELTNLFLSTPINGDTIPKFAAARNLSYVEVESASSNISFRNFRNVFTKPRTNESHGARRNLQGNSTSLSTTNSVELAVAQQSYMLMYGLTQVDEDNLNHFNPSLGDGFAITNQWARKSVNVGTDPAIQIRDYIFEGISEGESQQITFYVHTNIPAPSADQLFLIRTSGHLNQDPTNHQLRRINSISSVQEEKLISGVGDYAENFYPIPYRKYTITTKKTKEHQDFDLLQVADNSEDQENTIAITSANPFTNIEVGDTVWDRSTLGTPVAQSEESGYKPAIVIRKEDQGRRLIVLQAENGVGGAQISLGTRNIRFCWEWSLLPNLIQTTNIYPTDMRPNRSSPNDTLTFTTQNTGLSTDLFTDIAAAYRYLVVQSGI